VPAKKNFKKYRAVCYRHGRSVRFENFSTYKTASEWAREASFEYSMVAVQHWYGETWRLAFNPSRDSSATRPRDPGDEVGGEGIALARRASVRDCYGGR
jgi:hypothetical protein